MFIKYYNSFYSVYKQDFKNVLENNVFPSENNFEAKTELLTHNSLQNIMLK